MSMPSDNVEAGDSPRRKAQRHRVLSWLGRSALAALLVLAGALVAVVGLYLYLARPFPREVEVERMTATVYDRQAGKTVTFDVPRSHWEAVFSSLLPANKDHSPAKWEILGTLDLKLKNGDPFYIALFSLQQHDLGAFAAGPTFDRRVYYRGGNSAALENAINEALKAARNNH